MKIIERLLKLEDRAAGASNKISGRRQQDDYPQPFSAVGTIGNQHHSDQQYGSNIDPVRLIRKDGDEFNVDRSRSPCDATPEKALSKRTTHSHTRSYACIRPRHRAMLSTMRAIGYVRVSTDKQADHGVSLEAQEAKIRAMATVQGAEITELIVDGGESAKDLKRPGMERLLTLVDERKVDSVIIAKLDRLTRSVKDLAELLERFQRRRRPPRGCHAP
jgi:hypothetical protein